MQTEIAQNSPRKRGRPKGSKSKPAPDTDAFIHRIERAAGRSLEELLAKALLNHRTTALVALRLLEYKLGTPRQSLEISGSLNVAAIVAQARARVAGMNALAITPPTLKPIQIEGDSGGPTSNTGAGVLDGQVVTSCDQELDKI